jgi:5-methylcytosine-specific restriction endonuclease McrA
MNKEKDLNRLKKWGEENPEKLFSAKKKWREDNPDYYQKNKEKIAVKAKQWRKKNPEKVALYGKRYIEKNPEVRKKYKKEHKKNISITNSEWYNKNKEKVSILHKKWLKDNPEKILIDTANRRANSQRTPEELKITKEQFQELLVEYNNKCVYCGEEVKLGPDHVIPLSRGGLDTKDNIVPACRHCNCSKGARTPEQWGHAILGYKI